VARSRVRIWLVIFFVPILLVLGGIGYLAWRQSVAAVRVEFSPVPRFIGARTPITLDLHARRGGVQSVDVRIMQGGTRVSVAQQTFSGAPSNDQRVQLIVAGGSLGLREGAATLEVRARDGFWRPIRVDDRVVASLPVTLDFTPPTLEVLSSTRYLSRGGGGLVALRAKGAARVGVTVGDLFFPGFPAGAADSGLYATLYALPWNLPPSSPITVAAQDEAGNAVSRALAVDIRPRRFPIDTIDIGEQFLASKMPELLPERGAIPPDQLLAAFLTVNRDKRKEAEQMKRTLAQKSKPSPLFEGAFLQPRNTKVFSNFAETRTYRYQGKEVDTQVHLGYDLASLKHSPVPAANSGVVVFAAPLNIYGNAVVVDHGWGLQTLYGHLSTLEVKEGDQVKKGQELGKSGSTGLALGDHLHFEVLIQGISVTPVEWWDGKWIRDHIGRPLMEASVPLLQSEYPADKAAPAAAERPAAPAKKRGTARAR
jgi:murein DD-endopeptidase MepM/ murein hydrolase activator NlpD